MLALLLAVPAVLAPQEESTTQEPVSAFSYTYVEAGYFTVDYDVFNESSDGFAFGASVEVAEYAHVFGSYSFENLEVGGTDVDGNTLALGVGLHKAVHEKVDIVGEVAFLSAKAEALGQSETETGFGLTAGVRTMPVERLELDAAITYVDIVEDDTNFGFGARGYVTEEFSVGASVVLDDDGNSYGLSLRYEF